MLQTQTTTTRTPSVRAASPGLRQPPRTTSLQRQTRPTQILAKGLGWFSVALGLSQLIAPRGLARMIGVRDDRRGVGSMLAVGLREIASGIGILATRERRAPWLWTRVGGDVIDLALLGKAVIDRRKRRDTMQLVAAISAVVGVTALDLVAAARLSQRKDYVAMHRRQLEQVGTNVITINAAPEEVYRFWRDFENLPRFMKNVASVTMLDERRVLWAVNGPGGLRIEWIAEVVADRVNEAIIWRSIEGADVDNSGSVQFVRAPGGRGTEVWVEIRYDAPAGKIGSAIAKLFKKAPGLMVQNELRRLKQLIEVGEIVQSDASIHRGRHPAQPARARLESTREKKEVLP